MRKQTACDECKGTGKVGKYEYPNGNRRTDCPWCGGSGKVDVAYVLRSHGFNGDHSFSEVECVVDSVAKARTKAVQVMKTGRYRNVLEDGTPTITWMEITGPGIEESLGLEADSAGKLSWSDEGVIA